MICNESLDAGHGHPASCFEYWLLVFPTNLFMLILCTIPNLWWGVPKHFQKNASGKPPYVACFPACPCQWEAKNRLSHWSPIFNSDMFYWQYLPRKQAGQLQILHTCWGVIYLPNPMFPDWTLLIPVFYAKFCARCQFLPLQIALQWNFLDQIYNADLKVFFSDLWFFCYVTKHVALIDRIQNFYYFNGM